MVRQNNKETPLPLEDLAAALLYYYGVIAWDDLYIQLKDCFRVEAGKTAAWQYLQDKLKNSPILPFGCENRLFIYHKVNKPRNLLLEQAKRPAVSWRPVTEAEARFLASGQEEMLWGDPEHKFLDWIKAHKKGGKKTAVKIYSEYINEMRNDTPFQDIIRSMSYDFPLDGLEELQEMTGLVNRVWNHIPRWELKGWSSMEVLERYERDSVQPLSSRQFAPDAQSSGIDWSAVGRNDPCPCGSGRKFKKCCLPKVEAGEFPSIMEEPRDLKGTPAVEPGPSSVPAEKVQKAKEKFSSPSAPKKGRRADPRYHETLGRLLDLFVEFIDLEPWDWMDDSQLFAIDLPETTCYVSVFGAGGDLFGLSIYPGNQGLQYYLSMEQAAFFDIEEITDLEEIGPSLLLVLGDRDELSSPELRIYKESPYRFYGRGGWPVFRSYQPGCWPWRLSLEEAELAAAVLAESTGIVKYHRSHRRQIEQRNQRGEIPCYRPGVHKRSKPDQWLDLPSFISGVKQWSLPDIDLQRLRKIKKYSPAWEMDWFYLPIGINENKQQAPIMPIATLLIDPDLPEIALEPEIRGRSDWDPARILAAAMVKQDRKPEKILVSSTPKAYALDLLAQQLGLEIAVEHDLLLNDLKNALLTSLDR